MVHKDIVITGMVQGVGFRYTARQVAESLGITGFVRNLYDGSVYIEAEGSETNMENFLAWCHQGPPHAVVENVTSTNGNKKSFTCFDITL
ncbi:MAG: acylphosphatase [Bacteroidales bacterium]|nr:acylphosphatase [Bacteroidales bacterium]